MNRKPLPFAWWLAMAVAVGFLAVAVAVIRGEW